MSLLASACTAKPGVGTYTAKVSGAATATLTGIASAEESGPLSSAGHYYYISLVLPEHIPGVKLAPGGTMMIVSERQVPEGEYRVVDGAGTNPNGTLGVKLTGDASPVWTTLEGRISIHVGGSPSTKRAGTFWTRFASEDQKDTIVVRGKFDIP